MRLKVTFSRRTVLTILMAASVVTALLGRGFAGRVREVAAVALAPFGDGAMYAVTALEKRVGQIGERGLSIEEHRALREERDELARLANYWKSLAEQYRRQARAAKNFRGLYGPQADLKCELVAARVVAMDALSYGQMLAISARGADRARPGALVTTRQIVTDRSKSLPPNLAVINATSLVGCLTDQTRAFTARVRLVTDRGFWIKARIRRRIHPDPKKRRTIRPLGQDAAEELLTEANNGPVDCTAFGDGARGMYIPDVPGLHNIRRGDWVVSFPDGAYSGIELFIGRVTKVTPKTDNQRYVTVNVAPAADLSTLYEVFVVVPIGP